MKVLIVVSCILAAVSAGYVGHSAYGYGVHGYHVPVLDHNGYQLDTPEVAHAKAAHFAAHAEANSRSGHGLYAAVAGPLAYAGHYGGHYAGPQHIPVIGPNGVPLDTPEVAAGKVANAVAHAEANARNGDYYGLGYAGHGLVAHGVPHDTPEVAHAKAAHFAAHAEANARAYGHPLAHYRKRRGVYAYPQHIPVIGHNGVPLDTPEVAAAKAHHAAAHAEAHARNGGLHHVAPLAYAGLAHAGYAHAGYAHAYAGPQHIPVIGPNGVPLDTPEVAAGKVANAVAHAEANARNGDYYGLAGHGLVAPVAHYAAAHHVPVIGHNGVPLDTPEVAAAKAHHAAAHAEAHARNAHGHYY